MKMDLERTSLVVFFIIVWLTVTDSDAACRHRKHKLHHQHHAQLDHGTFIRGYYVAYNANNARMFYHNGEYFNYFHNGEYYNYVNNGKYYRYFVNGSFYNYVYGGKYYSNCPQSSDNWQRGKWEVCSDA